MSERPGMSYSEGRTRIMRMASNNHGNMQQKVNLSKSILNQVRIREGEGAVREIVREANRGR